MQAHGTRASIEVFQHKATTLPVWCKTDTLSFFFRCRSIVQNGSAVQPALAVSFCASGGESKGGGRSPLLGRFKGIGFSGKGGNRNPPSPERVFRPFLHEQKETGARAAQARKKTSLHRSQKKKKWMHSRSPLQNKSNLQNGAKNGGTETAV